jgi:hypothetical protein
MKSCSLLSDSGKDGLRASKNVGRVQKCRLGRQRANQEGYQLRGLSAARSSRRAPHRKSQRRIGTAKACPPLSSRALAPLAV